MGLPRPGLTLGACLTLAACVDMPVDSSASTLLEARPDTHEVDAVPPVFGAADEVEVHDSPAGGFRVHYARRGPHAVPTADAEADGVPDYVQTVAREYDRVLRFYVDVLGFAPPRSDDGAFDDALGDARFDVYLVDFPTRADGAYRDELCEGESPRKCAGYMLQENDFDGRGYPSLEVATRTLASHELFHAVQSGYAAGVSAVLGEATAVWASEAYDGSLDDFERLVGGYLARPDRSLAQEPIGPVDAFSYGAALFFRFLEETRGPHLVRVLWETLSHEPVPWPEALDQRLREGESDSLTAAFAQFALWNLHTASRADPAVAYAEGARYPPVSETAVPLPLADPLVRMAPLSARYFVATVETGGLLEASLSSLTQGSEDLLLRVLIERAGRLLPAGDAPEHVLASVQPGDRVHLLVIDARIAGPIRRIALCLRAPTELPCAGGPI